MIEQISALLEESHLIAYATAITQNHTEKETGKCRNKKSGLLSKTLAMKPSLKRSHAAYLQVRRMWRPGIRPAPRMHWAEGFKID